VGKVGVLLTPYNAFLNAVDSDPVVLMTFGVPLCRRSAWARLAFG
jgi:hypothetical protein